MRYIITYMIKNKSGELRAGARRKEMLRFDCEDEEKAIKTFKAFCNMSFDTQKEYDLFTGDWKHVLTFRRDKDE